MKFKLSSGQSLIEVLTALAVVLLVIVALIKATTISMRSGGLSKAQAQATAYAQEAIEWTRAERDKDWDNLLLGDFCMNELSWLSGGACADFTLGDRFKREVSLTGGGNQVKVEVVVSWQEAGGTHQSQITTYLTNWR